MLFKMLLYQLRGFLINLKLFITFLQPYCLPCSVYGKGVTVVTPKNLSHFPVSQKNIARCDRSESVITYAPVISVAIRTEEYCVGGRAGKIGLSAELAFIMYITAATVNLRKPCGNLQFRHGYCLIRITFIKFTRDLQKQGLIFSFKNLESVIVCRVMIPAKEIGFRLLFGFRQGRYKPGLKITVKELNLRKRDLPGDGIAFNPEANEIRHIFTDIPVLDTPFCGGNGILLLAIRALHYQSFCRIIGT